MTNTQAARALGWFSLGLGAVQLAAPRWLGEQIGVGPHPGLMRTCGAREAATGALILARPQDARGLWARTAGDMIDLAVLGASARDRDLQRLMIATTMVAGVMALDYTVARRLERDSELAPIEHEAGITVH